MYKHLVAREHPWRRQLWLKGRSMTVGQFVATAAIEGWSVEEAADQMSLPIEQVREAFHYHEANRELVDSELRQEKERLRAKGYPVDPAPPEGRAVRASTA